MPCYTVFRTHEKKEKCVVKAWQGGENVSEEEKSIIETIAQAVDILPPLQRERLLGQAEGVLLHAEAVRAKEKAPDEPGQETKPLPGKA